MAGEKSRLQLLKEIKAKEQEIAKFALDNDLRFKKNKVEALKLEADSIALKKESAKILEDNLKTFASSEKSISRISNSYRDFKNQQKETNDLAKSLGDDITPQQAKGIAEVLSLSRDLSELNIEDTIQIEAATNEIDNKIANLQKVLKLNDKVLDSLKKQNIAGGNIAKSTKEEKESLKASDTASEKLKEKFQGISETLESAARQVFNIFGFLGLAFAAAGKFAGKIAETNREIGNVGEGLGNLSFETGLMSLYFDNTTEGLKAFSQEFGNIPSDDVLADTILISKNIGVSATDAARLQQNFAGLNGGSKDIANNMLKTTQQFANQNNLIPSQLMADLAANTEQFALFGKDGGKNILAAAGYAAKLGVSMSQIAGITDNLLDFESSITKELELSAMLGKNINLSKARELAYAGDLKGATQETLRQLGGISAFNQMDYYQKKQTADLLGVTVEQFKKMATNQGQANDMSSIGVSQFDSMGELIANIGNTYIPTILTGIAGFLTLMALANKKTGILGKMFGGIGNAVGGAKDKLLAMVSGGKGPTGPLTKGGGPDMRFKTNKKSSGGLKSLAEGLKAMGNPKVLFGALNLIPTALGMVAMIAAIPGMLGIGLVGGMAGTGLLSLAPGLNAMSTAFSGIGALALLGLAGITMIAGSIGLGLLGPAGIAATAGLSALTPALVALGTAMATGVGALGLAALIAMGVGMGASFALIGVGAMAMGKGIQYAAQGFSTLLPTISAFMEGINLEKVGELYLFSIAIAGLAGSMLLLGASLAFLGATGLPGLAMLAGIAALSVPIIKLASMLGIGGESSEETSAIEQGGESLEQQMLNQLKLMTSALEKGHIIKMNGQTVGKTIFSNEDNNQMQATAIN
jgi:hypothetical protein